MGKVILVTTGCGNTVVGGADIWVNNFLKEVWTKLDNKKNYKLLIDSKRPNSFEEKSLPKGIDFNFHHENPEKTDEWCKSASWIHFLHPHYHPRPHLLKYEDKFGICFVHAYPRDMKSIINNLPEISKLQLSTNVDEKWYDEFLLTCKRRIWIGLDSKTTLFKNFPNYTYLLPNYYEFRGPASLTTNVSNGAVGYAARIETRKCFHWMHGINEGFALTSSRDVENLKSVSRFTFKTTDVYEWNPNIHKAFMTKNWGIFHGAYFKEPFGYSIFEAVDYGKLPIINTDWAPEVDYKYRASTKNEFDNSIKQILKDSQQTRVEERNKLIQFMKKFDNKKEWVDQIRSQLLSFY